MTTTPIASDIAKRRESVQRMLAKHPNSVACFISRHPKCTTLPELSRNKFLIDRNQTFGFLQQIVRQRLPALREEQALYYAIFDPRNPNRTASIPAGSECMLALYDKHKSDQDLMLHIHYQSESTFGGL